MRIGVVSDIHDNLWNLAPAIQFLADADVLLCCGDLCSPFVIDELTKFPKDVHIVFGNNDADLFRITAKAGKKPNCHVHGEFFQAELGGKRIAVNHFDYLARPIAKSGDYDVVCFGHNHELEISQEGPCLLLNPGPIMGAKFPAGKWENTASTFLVYDTESHQASTFQVNSQNSSVVTL